MSSHGGSRPASVSAVSSTTTVTSEMSMAYRNRKVMKRLNSWYYGSGKFPFKVAIVCFIVGFLIFFAGIVLLALIFDQRQLDIGNWWGNIIAAGLIVIGILVFALGVKFLFDARAKSTKDRKKLAFRPKGLTKVSVVNNAFESDKESNYKTKSGTSSIKAVNSPYASSVGSRSHVSHSVHSAARTGDSLPSLDNRPIHYSSNPNPDRDRDRDRPQGRYQQNPNRYDNRGYDRGYDDRDRGRGGGGYDRHDDRNRNGRPYDDRGRASLDRNYDDRDRSRGGSTDRHYDDRSRGSNDRQYDDRRRDPPSRSASRDFSDIPLDGDTYI